jgi:hypothetical protein
MTRAVIKLAKDINQAMPKLSKVINGCAYDAEGHSLGFRVEDYSVVINGQQMLIVGTENEAQARSVLHWLSGKINGSDTPVKGEGNYLYHNKLS